MVQQMSKKKVTILKVEVNLGDMVSLLYNMCEALEQEYNVDNALTEVTFGELCDYLESRRKETLQLWETRFIDNNSQEDNLSGGGG